MGDDIQVTVLGIKGNQVRIGIDAPEDVVILREELVANDNQEGADAVIESAPQ